MNTIKGSSLWLYFFKTDDPYRVKCKLCRSTLGSKRRFNLKQHLKRAHKIEVRLRKGRRNEKDQEFIKAEFMEENDVESNTTIVVNEAMETNEHIISDPVPPLVPFESKNTKATTNEIDVQDSLDHIDPLATRSVFNLNSDSQELNNVVLNNNNKFVEPQQRDSEQQIMIDGTLYQVKQTGRANNKRASKPKNFPALSENPVTDTALADGQPPPSPKKEEDFDEVFRKRKQLTELEYLQMQNYKMKLELWAMEQKLQVKNSKFTKDILAR